MDDSQAYGVALTDDIRNLTAQVQTVSYIFKALIKDPQGDGTPAECNEGADTTIVIRINPSPEIFVEVLDGRDTICNEDFVVLDITNPNLLIEGDWKYKLEITYDKEDSIFGTLPAVSFIDDADDITDILSNVSQVWQTVTYKFTPYIISLNGDSCISGRDTSITVWVNPTPTIRVFTEDSVICNGGSTTIDIINTNEFVYGIWEYDLTIVPDPEISGVSDTTYYKLTDLVIPVSLLNEDTVIHKVAYYFIPKESSGMACGGGNDTVIYIWVNPTPEIRVKASDEIICDGESFNLEVRNPNFLVDGAWMYNLEIIAEHGISGVVSGVDTYNSDTIFPYTLFNSDQQARKVTYQFVPRIIDTDGDECNTPDDTLEIVIWVNPVPDIEVSIPDTVLCNGGYSLISIDSPNTSIQGIWMYDLEVTPDSSIRGARDSAQNLTSANNFIDDQLFNDDTVVHKVVYHFIPRISPSDGGINCENGKDTTITIWVNPAPRGLYYLPDNIFCNNEITDILIKDGLAAVEGDKVYFVKALYTPGTMTLVSREFDGLDTLYSGEFISDVLINHTNTVQPVFYTISPRIIDTRPGHEGEFCSNGNDTIIEIAVNPSPEILVDIVDTIFCDNSILSISLIDGLGDVEGTPVYDIDVSYLEGAVEPAGLTAVGEKSDFVDLSDLLMNNTDSVQEITYHFTARIRDDRPGHEGDYCDNGTDTTITVYLNPTPKLSYRLQTRDLALEEDTLCYDEGFAINIDSIASTTHGVFYKFSKYEFGIIDNVNDQPDSLRANTLWNEYDVINLNNLNDSVETILYEIHPYTNIGYRECPGSDTTIIIKVNPEPVMEVTKSADAVCFDWGYSFPMNTEVSSTTGQMRYSLTTGGYNAGVVSGVPASYISDILELGQDSVLNFGDSIEDVTYLFTPVIENARSSGHCLGSPKSPIIVRVAPELEGYLEAETAIGGWEIPCADSVSLPVHSKIRGGFYEKPYEFIWETDGGNSGLLDQADSVQQFLSLGEYWYSVRDSIGCEFFSDTIVIEEPPPFNVEHVITSPSTCHKYDGAIDITPTGSQPGYSYYWWTIGIWNDNVQDPTNIPGGPFWLELSDVNGCTFNAFYEVLTADPIRITKTPKEYGSYNITCNGDNTGEIYVSDIEGGFPGYTLYLYDEEDVINVNQIETSVPIFEEVLDGGTYSATISDLPQGNYYLVARDTADCSNYYYDLISLEEPDSISIIKTNAPYHNLVDISCYGAEDGVIDISVTGGHTDSLDNDFFWSGPGAGLNESDSIQIDSTLSPGLYKVRVWNQFCEDSAQFTLIEPPQILLDTAILSDYHGWQIACFGGENGSIDVESSGGIPNHNYLWESDQMVFADNALQDMENLVAGYYHITITDGIGCIREDSFELRHPNKLEVDPDIPRRNSWEIACAGDSSGLITLTPYGGADSTQNLYDWSQGDYVEDDTSMNQTNLPIGTYKIHVTDINGCELDSIFIMEEPDPIVIDSLISYPADCANSPSGSINLEAHGGVPVFSYLWTLEGETVDTIADLEGRIAGVYYLTITDMNGCVDTASIVVGEADLFFVNLEVATDFNGSPISCADSSNAIITLESFGGTEPYFYEWSNGATTKDLVGVPAGTYSVYIRDEHSCSDSAEVTITEPAPLDYTLRYDDPLCYNDSTGRIELLLRGGTVTALTDYRVQINQMVAGPYVENLPAGEYEIMIEDLNDCFEETVVTLEQPDSLQLGFETEDAFCKDKQDGELRLFAEGGAAPYSISWDRGLPDNEDWFNDVYWGDYVATVTDFNNCVTIDTAYVDYTHISCLVVPNAFSPNSDGYNDMWLIEGLELYPEPEIRIFDRWGSEVYHSQNPVNDPWNGSFNGRNLPIDSYHYIIDLKNGEVPITGNITIVR